MDQDQEEPREEGLAGKIPALGQEVIGQIEMIGGVLTADPITQAEGEFNAEVGEMREELEDQLPDDET